MAFPYQFSRVKEQEFQLIEPGWYPFRIVEAEEMRSKKGDPMVKIVAACLDPENRNRQVWHWVVFLPEDSKGSGISKHFVKSIGLPVDKDSMVEPDEWLGKTFMGKVTVSEYDGKKNNKFEAISPIKDDAGIDKPAADSEEDSPF